MEHKRFTGAHSPEAVITRKYAGEWAPGQKRYDPVEDEKNKALYQQYLKLAKYIPMLRLADGWMSTEVAQWTRPLPPRVKRRKN